MTTNREKKYWDELQNYLMDNGHISAQTFAVKFNTIPRNARKILNIFYNQGKLTRAIHDFSYIYSMVPLTATVGEDVFEEDELDVDDEPTPQPQSSEVLERDGFSRYVKTDLGESWHVQCGRRELTVPKITLKRIKELYCGDRNDVMSINAVCRELDIPRHQLTFITAAFGITHDDVPFDDEDLMENSVDALVNITKERQKKNYFLKLKEEELKSARKEIASLRNKVFRENEIIREFRELNLHAPEYYPISDIAKNTLKEALLCIQDIHFGLTYSSHWNVYDTEIAWERMRTLVKNVVEKTRNHNISKIHVFSLGDLIHGMIHISTRVQSEINVVKQVVGVSELIAYMLDSFAECFSEVEYHQTRGNHGRMTSDKFASVDEENYEEFIMYFLRERYNGHNVVKINPTNIDGDIIYKEILGHPVFGIHGHNDKIQKVASDLTMMVGTKPEQIFMGHKHHSQSEEIHGVDVIIGESFCGFEGYAKQIRAMAHAGQSFYIYDKYHGLECEYKVRFG